MPSAARGEQIPHAVAHHEAVANVDADARRGGEEQVGVGLGVAHEVARDHRHVVGQVEQRPGPAGRALRPAGRDRPGNPQLGQAAQRLARAGQRAHAWVVAHVRLGVQVGQPGDHLVVERLAELAAQGGHEQAAAHPDAAVDLPNGERHAELLERLAPGDHVLVDAVGSASRRGRTGTPSPCGCSRFHPGAHASRGLGRVVGPRAIPIEAGLKQRHGSIGSCTTN